jgi:hypothetical protein
MADKQSERSDTRINVEDETDLRFWASQFGVSVEELRQAAKAAGPMLKDVRERLARDRSY